MSLSEILIRIVGIIFIVVGAGLLLAMVGLSFVGVGLSPWWVELIAGVLFLGCGIWLVRGGTVSL